MLTSIPALFWTGVKIDYHVFGTGRIDRGELVAPERIPIVRSSFS